MAKLAVLAELTLKHHILRAHYMVIAWDRAVNVLFTPLGTHFHAVGPSLRTYLPCFVSSTRAHHSLRADSMHMEL